MAEHSNVVAYIGILIIYSIILTAWAPYIDVEGFDINPPEYPPQCSDTITEDCFEIDPNLIEWVFGGFAVITFILSQLFFIITIIVNVPAVSGITLLILTPILYKILLEILGLFGLGK